MNGKSGVASDSLVTDCSTSRARGPATDNPTSDRPSTSKRTSVGAGKWARNHREWCTSAICEPNRKNSSSPVRATENSPTIRPSGLSIGVSAMRPGFGRRLVNRPCSHSAVPGPVTRYLAKLEHSVRPTRSRTARHSSATTRERVGAPERDVLDRFLAGTLEPQRVLEPEAGAPHRVVRGEAVVHRRRVQRPSRRQFLVRERDAEAPAVVLPHLGVGVGEVGPVAEPGHVHPPHVELRIARGHPVGQGEPDAATLGQARHHRARDPAVADTPDRPDERVAVGRERERPVDHPLDPRRRHGRVVLERDLQRGGDAVEVGRQQLLVEGPRRDLRRPRHARLLVRAHQHPTLLLADVDLALEVEGHRQLVTALGVEGGDLVHVVGDEVHVLHAEDGQFQADHPPDLACPQPAGVDDVLGVDLTLVGDDVPRAVGPLAQVLDPRVAVDLGAGLAGADRVRGGHPARVDVTLDRVEQGADEVLLLHQREQVSGLGGGDDLELHAEVAPAGLGHAQPVEAFAVAGQHQPAGQVDRAVLAGTGFDRAVQLDRVLLQLGHVGIAVERVHPTRRVPRRPGRELLAFDQHDVVPPRLREVVEHRSTDDATADDDDLG